MVGKFCARYSSKARPYYQMHRLPGQYWRISKDVRRHDQSFMQIFRLISLISLISAEMALLAGVLAWFILQSSSARGKQLAP